MRRIPIVVASAALRPFASVWRASTPLVAEAGVMAVFLGGVAAAALGPIAPWCVLAALLIGAGLRRADLESWALFIPGGLAGRVQEAFGRRPARIVAASALVERVLFVAIASVAAGQYAISFFVALLRQSRFASKLAPEDLITPVAVAFVGLVWVRARLGRSVSGPARVAAIWAAVAVLVALVLVGVAVGAHVTASAPAMFDLDALKRSLAGGARGAWPVGIGAVLAGLAGLGVALPAIGTAEWLNPVAVDLPPPRVLGLRRSLVLVTAFTLVVTAASACLFLVVVPERAQSVFFDLPLIGIARVLSAPVWIREVATVVVVGAAVVMLLSALETGLAGTQAVLRGLAERGVLPEAILTPHLRFGTSSRLIDTASAAAVAAILASGGRVAWLAGAYGVALVATQVFKVAALARLRRRRALPVAGRTPALWILVALATAAALARLGFGDASAWAGVGVCAAVAVLFAMSDRHAAPSAVAEPPDAFQLLPPSELSLDQVAARPGGVLVAVRHPHSLAHLAAALRHAGDRDVVVMTARLLGAEADSDIASDVRPTPAESVLFSQVIALAEGHGRPIRLLIVPTHDVFDAVVAAVVRLQSSEVFVGESATLAGSTQARLLGEAWERADKPEALQVRLVIHHHTGRDDTFFLGAHAPSLTPLDVDLIHHMWLDAAQVVGAHLHHHDVVRAALLHMSQQLNGPQRDEVLDAITRVARPAEDLAAVVHSRDFSQLRDMVRNLPPDTLARLLTDLGLEDQVVVFRLLPRKDAAAAFEYLSQERQETLLKAMAQEDVASLLNEMAPDDRTMFLEELPATVTRQLLALLTPEERSIASKLLGYPEGSIGRLMTPSYVAVHEDWTIQRVLDYIREHGEDRETLNVIYVVDDQGLLIDDIRIREILLTPPDRRVSTIMDRRFVALKATDNEEAAVATFKQHDRTALPVTDTAGVLIGIVTVDDVLDVAEAKATKEIQRIGGSEALDEPYNTIPFWLMIKKRAGWLTALFLGEMLTATAMGVYQDQIAKAVVLALFIPLTISSGGNSGSQASTLIIRAMALGEVKLTDWFRIMRRELLAGLTLGAILGTVGVLRITIWSEGAKVAHYHAPYGEYWPLVALTVGLALIGVVTWGSLVGSLLPLALRRLGFDPATSSAPFVATLVDVTGLIIYFSVAMVILKGTLL